MDSSASPDINIDKVCYRVVKARELGVKVAPADPGQSGAAPDDAPEAILFDLADDPTIQEVTEFLRPWPPEFRDGPPLEPYP